MINITSQTTTTLYGIAVDDQVKTVKTSLRITNNHSDVQEISIFLHDGAAVAHYLIKNLIIPKATAFQLDEVEFENYKYSLHITTHSSTTNITVIEK
tara:strand:+ start:148 stop:438 length:291 start_codon:yes stop_codon:yes gene_type:complete